MASHRPASRYGVKRSSVAPFPTLPNELLPQHHPVSFVRVPHVTHAEAVRELQEPDNSYGVRRSVAVPSPTVPLWLSPQHHPEVSSWMPHAVKPFFSRVCHAPGSW
jgi:hypothetical protein